MDGKTPGEGGGGEFNLPLFFFLLLETNLGDDDAVHLGCANVSGSHAEHLTTNLKGFLPPSDSHLTTPLCLLRYANDSEEERCHLAALQKKRKQVPQKRGFLITFLTDGRRPSSDGATLTSVRLKRGPRC